MESEYFSPQLLIKLSCIYIYSLLSAAYCWSIVRARKPGWTRFLIATPVVVGNLAVPLVLDPAKEALLITPLAGVLSLAAFKVLAYCFARGPLALPLTCTQFIAVLLLPIIPHAVFTVSGGQKIPDEAGGAARGTQQLLADYGKQVGCASVVALILVAFPNLHWFPRHWLYTLCSCMFLGGVFDALGAFATSLLQVPVAPTFNRPWMSETFADFWARRWNLTTTYMMRVLVYEPAMAGRLLPDPQQDIKKKIDLQQPNGNEQAASKTKEGIASVVRQRTNYPASVDDSTDGQVQPADTQDVSKQQRSKRGGRMLRRLAALQATFMFSGVWHILVFWYNTRVVSLRWALFFIIQAPIVMVEAIFIRAWNKAGLPVLPKPIRIVLTNAALIAIAGPLFFGPADDTGFATRNLAAVKPVLDFLVHGVRHLAGSHQALHNGTATPEHMAALLGSQDSASLTSKHNVSLPISSNMADELHPFTSYNQQEQTEAAVLCGNWVEERALKAATGANRYEPWIKQDQPTLYATRQDKVSEMQTHPRVIEHGEQTAPHNWSSMYGATYRAPKTSPQLLEYRTDATLGPKAKLELQAMQQLASALPTDPQVPITSMGIPTAMDTTYQSDFVPQELTANTVGARAMKDRDGRPAVRDPTFLAETQLVPKQMADRLFGATAQLAGATRTSMLPDPDVPITIYSEAVATKRYGGNIAGTRPLCNTQPFNKYSNFSKPMGEYNKVVDDE